MGREPPRSEILLLLVASSSSSTSLYIFYYVHVSHCQSTVHLTCADIIHLVFSDDRPFRRNLNEPLTPFYVAPISSRPKQKHQQHQPLTALYHWIQDVEEEELLLRCSCTVVAQFTSFRRIKNYCNRLTGGLGLTDAVYWREGSITQVPAIPRNKLYGLLML